MKILILSIFPVGFFLLGFFIAKLQRPEPDVRKLRIAENLIDELQVMAAEHQQYEENFAVLAMGKIVDYHFERNQI